VSNETFPIHPVQYEQLLETPVKEAATALAKSYAMIKPDSDMLSLVWGMQHFFLKRYVLATERSFPNYDEDISKNLSELVKKSPADVYEKELEKIWKKIMKGHINMEYAEEEYYDKTGERVKPHWKDPAWMKINEVIVSQPDSLGTATGLQLGAKEYWRNPSKEAAFTNPRKQLPGKNHWLDSAKGAVQRVIKRNLTWIRDPQNKSETAYIGHGRKVRVGFDNPSLSPMTIKINAKHLPTDEALTKMLTGEQITTV